MDIEDIKNSIESHFLRSNDVSIGEGMQWYANARAKAVRLSEALDIELSIVCGVIAALSPRNKWNRNIEDTISILRKGDKATVATFGANKRKALKILESDGSREAIETILNGRKTVSFFTNILFPFKNDRVTIDVWAIRAAGVDKKSVTKKQYSIIEGCYRKIAHEKGILAHQLQAIIWCTVRNQ